MSVQRSLVRVTERPLLVVTDCDLHAVCALCAVHELLGVHALRDRSSPFYLSPQRAFFLLLRLD